MIRAILRKELTQCRRDGRAQSIGALMLGLLLLSLITAWSNSTAQRYRLQQAEQEDRRTFSRQGEKPPHSAAHFGRLAHKPVPPLAVFDSGASPYMGQVVWLEAHRQSPAMFRPAEDSPDMRRLADLSVAGILTMLLPLLVSLLGYGAFAAERERGTLRQIMSSGADLGSLFLGKLMTIAGVGILVSLTAIAVATGIAASNADQVAVADTILRGVGLALAYALYSLACAGIVLIVSALSRSATSALLILLSLWAVCIVVAPRVAASVAAQAYPAPDSVTFWADAAERQRAGRLRRDSEAYRALERQVLSRALGRQVGAREAETMALNRNGLNLEIGELLGARTYADAYEALYETYQQQQGIRRLFSVLSPAIVLQHASSALAGADTYAHRHFVLDAQRQRNEIVRRLNEDMMLNGAGQGFEYRTRAEFWETVPEFRYSAPAAAFGFRSALPDLLLLAAWSTLAVCLARSSARRLSPLT